MCPTTLPHPVRPPITGAGASWLSLVAETTRGLSQGRTIRLTVRLPPEQRQAPREPFRLIVHGYSCSPRARQGSPGSRPQLSYQRAVSWQRLKEGLTIDLQELTGYSVPVPRIVVWIEPGQPNLPYDGMLAVVPAYATHVDRGVEGCRGDGGAVELTLLVPPASRRTAA